MSVELAGGCLLQKLQWKSVPKMVMTISTVMTAIEEVITGTTARHCWGTEVLVKAKEPMLAREKDQSRV